MQLVRSRFCMGAASASSAAPSERHLNSIMCVLAQRHAQWAALAARRRLTVEIYVAH